MLRYSLKRPDEYSPSQRATFAGMLLEGGEVRGDGLEALIGTAHLLGFCEEKRGTLGIAALKNPRDTYRQKVIDGSGFALSKVDWPYELGWVYVAPWARRSGVAGALVEKLLEITPARVFATARVDNAPVHGLLHRQRFEPEGPPYDSDRGNYQVQLFLRGK